MTSRRKEQLKLINENLSSTIKDYTIFVRYDDAGITAAFELFMQQKMHGTYLQDDVIGNLCSHIAPAELAEWVLDHDCKKIAERAQISNEWAERIVEKLCYWNILFEWRFLRELRDTNKRLFTHDGR